LGIVVAAFVSTILAWAVVVFVVVIIHVAVVVLPRSALFGFVACLAALVASHLALATMWLIDNHLVVRQCSGH
jgi:hypothetical protein